jgi:hypothetical protein
VASIASSRSAARRSGAKFSVNCELPHSGAEKYVGTISPSINSTKGMQMRTGIGIAVVVAIGLIWSVAVMSQWVPLAGAEMRSAAVIQPYEGRRH